MQSRNTRLLPENKQLLWPGTELGAVHLSVTNENRALQFYQEVLGLTKLGSRGGRIHLGTRDGRELVVLYPGATKPFPRGHTGLYHLALAVPNLNELALVELRLTSLNYPNYPTDHTISKSIYLWDPDNNGIEVYKETPEEGGYYHEDGTIVVRDRRGNQKSGRERIDLNWLFGHLKPEDRGDTPLPDGTSMGHVHLHTAGVDEAMAFYSGVIGYQKFLLWPRFGMGDLTLNAYIPHRLAVNNWAGEGASQAPDGSSGLRHFTILLPTSGSLDALVARLRKLKMEFSNVSQGISLQDPSKNHIELTVSGKEAQPP